MKRDSGMNGPPEPCVICVILKNDGYRQRANRGRRIDNEYGPSYYRKPGDKGLYLIGHDVPVCRPCLSNRVV